MRIQSVTASLLEIPLVEPFVIATARVDRTPSVLVRAVLEGPRGAFVGLGEAACLPPVTRETPADVWGRFDSLGPALAGQWFDTPSSEAFDALVGEGLLDSPVARAGLQVALLDAFSRARGEHLARLLVPGLELPVAIVSDMTLPMLPEARLVELARAWRSKGFRTFKVKVGRDLDAELRMLRAVAKSVQDARFRLDANEGFLPAEALELAHGCLANGLALECFEQPCPRALAGGLEEVQAGLSGVPVIADESCRSEADLDALLRARPRVGGINLKVVKHGGILEAFRLGSRARREGLAVMVGGMVETRLGMGTAAALAACFPGVLADLDTAWLLAEDPFEGGYDADGERYVVGHGDGHGVELRA